jgi:hypothetical protein
MLIFIPKVWLCSRASLAYAMPATSTFVLHDDINHASSVNTASAFDTSPLLTRARTFCRGRRSSVLLIYRDGAISRRCRSTLTKFGFKLRRGPLRHHSHSNSTSCKVENGHIPSHLMFLKRCVTQRTDKQLPSYRHTPLCTMTANLIVYPHTTGRQTYIPLSSKKISPSADLLSAVYLMLAKFMSAKVEAHTERGGALQGVCPGYFHPTRQE